MERGKRQWKEMKSMHFIYIYTPFLSFFQNSPEAIKDKAIEADRLFRRGCLQYLEDLGLVNKADRRHY